MTATKFAFSKVIVADLGTSERFYSTVLGLEVTARYVLDDPADQMVEIFLAVPGAPRGTCQLGLISYPDRPSPAAGEAITGFIVKSIDAVIASAIDSGGKVVKAPVEMEPHGVRVVVLSDPEGHMIEVLEVLP